MLTLLIVAAIAFLFGVSVGRASSGTRTSTVVWQEMPEFDALPAEVRDAIASGRRVEAIRLLRKHAKVDLRAAKLAVDDYAAGRSPSDRLRG